MYVFDTQLISRNTMTDNSYIFVGIFQLSLMTLILAIELCLTQKYNMHKDVGWFECDVFIL